MGNVLTWFYHGGGAWVAQSRAHDRGFQFLWRIGVTPEGRFTPKESEPELVGDAEVSFATLAKTQAWCEQREAELR